VRIALTGGTGFLGAHVAQALRRRDFSVTALARSRAGGERLAGLGCRVVEGSLEDEDALARLVEGAEVVFHVAGVVIARSEADFHRVNEDGTRRVAEASRRAGVGRLLHVSSLAVTGPARPGTPVDETTPPHPVTPYGRSKRAGEDALRATGVAFTIVRPPMIYGPRDRELLRVFRMARRGVVALLGDGTQELVAVYAPDVAEALIAAATSAATLGGTYHAAHPDVVTQRAFTEAIGRAVRRRPMAVPVPRPVVRAVLHLSGAIARLRGTATLLSPERAEELLAAAWTCRSDALARDAGWRAATPLEEGLGETARWYREAGWL
jgi:nucleoside-diphosphate-sugar epimerase